MKPPTDNRRKRHDLNSGEKNHESVYGSGPSGM